VSTIRDGEAMRRMPDWGNGVGVRRSEGSSRAEFGAGLFYVYHQRDEDDSLDDTLCTTGDDAESNHPRPEVLSTMRANSRGDRPKSSRTTLASTSNPP
jgi:hypothetical protein